MSLPFRALLAWSALCCLLLVDARRVTAQLSQPPQPPPIAREFRAVWVAAVSNIDWPSRPGLSSFEQRTELLALLDRAMALRLNAVILHVRPAADALYRSALEPWSEYLTGQQGLAPEPAYDPLAFAVEQAHARGLELHAWFNPFRAFHPSSRTPDTAFTHVARAGRVAVVRYGRHRWLDPGDPRVRRHSLRVISDVVRRYDVDGVHIDDYFYPYRERDTPTSGEIPFPDDATYAAYRQGGGTLERGDWRRNNVDVFVRDMYRAVKAIKPHVKVGVSPFGIWRPGYPDGSCCFDAYEEIYADARKWLTNGWVDYFTPQLYWAIDSVRQSYPALLDWWVEQNVRRRHIWPGLFTSKVGAQAARPTESWAPTEIIDQILITRDQSGATGHVHFSMRALQPGVPIRDTLVARLTAEVYTEPALVPATPWLDAIPPARPTVRATRDTATGGVRLALTPGDQQAVRYWTVQLLGADAWTTRILPGSQRTHALTRNRKEPLPDAVWVTAVDRLGNQSRPVAVRLGALGARPTRRAVPSVAAPGFGGR
jgi:uncharacterized lipoprotein YddW (UPF0748 family)